MSRRLLDPNDSEMIAIIRFSAESLEGYHLLAQQKTRTGRNCPDLSPGNPG